MADRILIAACLVQARAHDGLKRSMVHIDSNTTKHIENYLDMSITQYRTFKAKTRMYPQRRDRLAYVVRLYLKNPAPTEAGVTLGQQENEYGY